jgi:Protein of unknown function (DUF3500)
MSKTWLLCIACAISLTVQAQTRNRPGTDPDPRAASGRGAALTADAAVADAMFAAATKLLGSVRGDPEFNEALRQFSMEDELLLPLDDPARRDWSYWPRERAGLKIDLMHAKHRALLQDLLWTALSAGGYHKVLNIMQLEYVLQPSSTTGFPRGIEEYTITLFSEPSTTAPWAWRFEGHHVSLNVLIVPGVGISVTPTFLGADPAEVAVGPLAGLRVMRAEEDIGRALVTSLSPPQRAQAILLGDPKFNADVAKFGFVYENNAPWDLVASNIMKDPKRWEEWREILRPDGIKVASLAPEQRALVGALLDEILGVYRPALAAKYWSTVKLDDLSFAWIGSLEPKQPHYYRLQGPDFVFEFDNVQGNGNHVHEVWRSRSGDFGDDLLKRHYETAH